LLVKGLFGGNADAGVQHVFPHESHPPLKENGMLNLAILFLVIALVAALLGFAGVAALSWDAAMVLFVVFLILAVLSFLGHGYRRGSYWGG
jgi:uncharacterized membrane protein YtjA (UPF0391 family)